MSAARPHVCRTLALLFLAGLVALTGCRRFSGMNLDLYAHLPQLEPGEKCEVEITALRHWDDEEPFRVELEAPPDLTITPSVLEFPAGHSGKVKVMVEVKPGAPDGYRTVKVRASPNVSCANSAFSWKVGKRDALPVAPAPREK